MEKASRALKCTEVFEHLSEYLDHEITDEMAECMTAHISGCSPCVRFLESLRKSIALCAEYGPQVRPKVLPDSLKGQMKQAYERALAACQSGKRSDKTQEI
ncbi:MAG TPA: zf-HC2 domain-containing protein [Bryobacteraceae bacterium]|nr:zf-HC2 domain-containing protein [Bryobacteraceae bacterium]